MIHVLIPGNESFAGEIVTAALERSFSRTRVVAVSPPRLHRLAQAGRSTTIVAVQPRNDWGTLLAHCLGVVGTKLLVLGSLPAELASRLQATACAIPDEWRESARCAPTQAHSFEESALQVRYSNADGEPAQIARRPFVRYDFTDEWNNLGYGAIRLDGSPWALTQVVQVPEHARLADVTLDGRTVSAYAARWENVSSTTADATRNSVLWFNRAVGPADSAEWRQVEIFFAHHRSADLHCQPAISEVPFGNTCAVTMRLDCDEDIASARPLLDLYRELHVPFSLAIHSNVLAEAENYARHSDLMLEVQACGGAILSHTATHAPDWGGSYDAAVNEGALSAQAIAKVTGREPRYAISPFHQTPAYARAALADVGYAGCVGGIIRNDPDFLMARAGRPPAAPQGFIGHTQQCMLHGDCMVAGDDPLAIFKQAFGIARRSRTFFGYLDHPFSQRYQYGWTSEDERLQRHRDFIAHIRTHDGVLFANEDDALDFLAYKSSVEVHETAGGLEVRTPKGPAPRLGTVAVEYKGAITSITEWECLA